MTTTARRVVTTEPQDPRAVLLGIAENLWSALLDLNASDVHGREDLAMQRDDLPYGQVHNALLGVLVPLVDGDADRARRVRELLSDNLESVAFNLAVEAGERKDARLTRLVAALEDDPRTGDEVSLHNLRAGMAVAMFQASGDVITGTVQDDDGWLRLGTWLLRYPDGGAACHAAESRFYLWDADPSEDMLPSDFYATV